MNSKNLGRRVFIFEPGLGKNTGHWENICRRLYQEFKTRDIAVKIFGQLDARATIVDCLPFEGVFSRDLFVDLKDETDFLVETEHFLNDFKRIDKAQFTAKDILIFTTLVPPFMNAALAWLNTIVKSNGPKAVFIFFIGAGQVDHSTNKSTFLFNCLSIPFLKKVILKKLSAWQDIIYIELYRKLVPTLKSQLKQQGYFFFGCCDEFSYNFSRILEIPVKTLPIMTNPAKHYHKKRQNGPLRIGYFGHASLEKGAQFLPRIIRTVTSCYKEVIFDIHVNPNIHTKDILKFFDVPHVNVNCYHGHRDHAELYDIMSQVDINLMPYAAYKYATMPSAVFTEGICFDHVLVIPDKTWMSNTAREINTGFVSFKKYEDTAIITALLSAIKNFAQLKRKTIRGRERYLQKNNVNYFVDIILKEIEHNKFAI